MRAGESLLLSIIPVVEASVSIDIATNHVVVIHIIGMYGTAITHHNS